MKNTELIIKTKSKTYPIYFGNNILTKTGSLIQNNLAGIKKICIISDNKLNIVNCYGVAMMSALFSKPRFLTR